MQPGSLGIVHTYIRLLGRQNEPPNTPDLFPGVRGLIMMTDSGLSLSSGRENVRDSEVYSHQTWLIYEKMRRGVQMASTEAMRVV